MAIIMAVLCSIAGNAMSTYSNPKAATAEYALAAARDILTNGRIA